MDGKNPCCRCRPKSGSESFLFFPATQVSNMRGTCLFLLLLTLMLSGCTEMRVEGDAKIFQSSANGSTIRIVAGLSLIGLGIIAFVGSLLPDRRPKNRAMRRDEGLSTGQRVCLGIFGGGMGFAGFFLALISFLFPSKLHVTVYPDRVAMASQYSQTGGREVVVPFAGLASVELKQEPGIVGKMQTFLVFTQKSGNVIRQDAGNNERQALETILQMLAEYQKSAPANKNSVASAMPNNSIESSRGRSEPSSNSGAMPQKSLSGTQANPPVADYALKRYVIGAALPEGYRLVDPADKFEAGTKLKANWGTSWFFVTIVAVNSDGTITCNWDDFPSYTYKMVREDLITVNEQASSIATPNTAPPPPVTFPPTIPQKTLQQYSLKRYPITIPVPKGYETVAPNAKVKVGSKLQACYASHWEFVTVVAVNEDGTITCNWDNWKSFTYKMVRDDLIIAERDNK